MYQVFAADNGNNISTPTAAPPPLGIRSAVPLGGLGTGSFELRADGSVQDWLVENQGPGLVHSLHRSSLWHGGKVGKPDFMLGLRATEAPGSAASTSGAPVAIIMRTAPPPGLRDSAVDVLTYVCVCV